jgi:hypothetical protein
MAYTQPFGNQGFGKPETLGDDVRIKPNSFCKDSGDLVSVVVGRWNLSGILTTLVESCDELICQCAGLHTIEVKSCHAVGMNGSLQLLSMDGRGAEDVAVWYEGGVSMAVLLLFTAASASSPIHGGG